MEASWLIWSSVFSLIGLAVLVYGRRQRLVTPTVVGLTLLAYPYFVSSVVAVVGIGMLLIAGLVAGSWLERRW